MKISVTSRPWVKNDISGDVNAIVGVRVAPLLHTGSPEESDWLGAELVDGAIRIKIGAGDGGHPLPAATYRWWVEIDAPGELIREPTGLVEITP